MSSLHAINRSSAVASLEPWQRGERDGFRTACQGLHSETDGFESQCLQHKIVRGFISILLCSFTVGKILRLQLQECFAPGPHCGTAILRPDVKSAATGLYGFQETSVPFGDVVKRRSSVRRQGSAANTTDILAILCNAAF